MVTIDNTDANVEQYTISFDGAGKLQIQGKFKAPANVSGGAVVGAKQLWTSNNVVNPQTLTIKTLQSGAAVATNIADIGPAIGGVTTKTDFTGPAALRNVIYDTTGLPAGKTTGVDVSNNTNDDIYVRTTFGDGGGAYTTSTKGINIIRFFDRAAAGQVNVTIPNDALIALDFSNVSSDVSANISSPRKILGGYKNADVVLTNPDSTKFIDVLVGGKGNDLLLGNDQDNLLIGFDGSDTLIGNGGNDQLNANRDYSPDVDGMPMGNNPAGLGDDYDQMDDKTKFMTTQNDFNMGASPTQKLVFDAFGQFGFGEGTGNNMSDFNFVNGLNPPMSNDLLDGGMGNDALFGFNNAVVTILGGPGNDIYSTNIKGGNALNDMGDGDDSIFYSSGDTAIGGLGDDSITEAAGLAGGPITFLFGEEGNDTINAGQAPDEIRPGGGTNLINLVSGDDTLIREGGTDTINGTPGFTLP